MFEKTLNIVPIPAMLVKWFIDLQSPRKIDVITSCKITDAISGHNAAYPLLIFDEETYFSVWFNFLKAKPETAVVKLLYSLKGGQ